jgi:hypothetical protein
MKTARHGRTGCVFQSRPSMLIGRFVMKTLGFCAAGLAEIPKRIDQSAIRHLPQLWKSLVRLQICADNVFNDLIGASRRKRLV